MDFAKLMQAQIAKKKAPSKTATTTTDSDDATSTTAPPPKKYQRNSEIEAERRARYLAEQKARDDARAAKEAQKRKREEEVAEEARVRDEKRRKLAEASRQRREEQAAEEERRRRKRLGLPELREEDSDKEEQQEDDENEDKEDDLDEEMLRTKLREMGLPVTLFGETENKRRRRYRREKKKRARALAEANGQQPRSGRDQPVPTTLDPVAEKDMKVPAVTLFPKDLPEHQATRQFVCRQLASYFNLLFREWGRALERKDDEGGKKGEKEEEEDEEEENAEAKKRARAVLQQSRQDIRPLFRRLEAGDLPDRLLRPIVEIVHAAQERRYVDANDAYLRLSIGKAAWPIGVIMVGIHERSSREKLHGGDQGGAMSDDVTRKYVQSIKRCLTFAQVRWPPSEAGQLMG